MLRPREAPARRRPTERMAVPRREAERPVALFGDGLQEERDRLMRAAQAAIDAGIEEQLPPA